MALSCRAEGSASRFGGALVSIVPGLGGAVRIYQAEQVAETGINRITACLECPRSRDHGTVSLAWPKLWVSAAPIGCAEHVEHTSAANLGNTVLIAVQPHDNEWIKY
jgi:hypothetical protein